MSGSLDMFSEISGVMLNAMNLGFMLTPSHSTDYAQTRNITTLLIIVNC